MPSYEVAIIRTNDDGTRDAVLISDTPDYTVPIARATGLPTYGFLWHVLRTTRRRDAPAGFQNAVMDEVTRIWAKSLFL